MFSWRENPRAELLPAWAVLVTVTLMSQDGQTPHLPITTFVARGVSVLHGDVGMQDSGMPNRWHVLGAGQIRAKGGFRSAPVSREVNSNPVVLMGLFFFPIRPPAPPVEKCSFWKRSSHGPSGSSLNCTCCARTASQPSSVPSPSTSSAARPLLSVPLPAASQPLALLGRTLEVARENSHFPPFSTSHKSTPLVCGIGLLLFCRELLLTPSFTHQFL